MTHHCVVIPMTVYLSSRLLLRSIHPEWPVMAPSVVRLTGTAKTTANQALKPIQKKMSHRPWLHDIRKPATGCSARLTNT